MSLPIPDKPCLLAYDKASVDAVLAAFLEARFLATRSIECTFLPLDPQELKNGCADHTELVDRSAGYDIELFCLDPSPGLVKLLIQGDSKIVVYGKSSYGLLEYPATDKVLFVCSFERFTIAAQLWTQRYSQKEIHWLCWLTTAGIGANTSTLIEAVYPELDALLLNVNERSKRGIERLLRMEEGSPAYYTLLDKGMELLKLKQ